MLYSPMTEHGGPVSHTQEDGDGSDDEGGRVLEEIKAYFRKEDRPTCDQWSDADIFCKTQDENTLLHLIPQDTRQGRFPKYTELIRRLISNEDTVTTVNELQQTALYMAVHNRALRLVEFICQTCEFDLDHVIANKPNDTGNCLHRALDIIDSKQCLMALVDRAGPETFNGRDNKGRTPLHVAAEYGRCTPQRLEVISAIMDKHDEALEAVTKEGLSPYRHLLESRTSISANDGPQKVRLTGKSGMPPVNVAGQTPPLESLRNSTVTGGGISSSLHNRDDLVEKDMQALLERTKKQGSMNEEPASAGAIHTNGVASHGELSHRRKMIPSLQRTASKDYMTSQAEKSRRTRSDLVDEAAKQMKLHFMRTRNDEKTLKFLYGNGQAKEIYLNLLDHSSLTFDGAALEDSLNHLDFDDILRCVALPRVFIESQSTSNKSLKLQEGERRNDAHQVFRYLQARKVQKVIRVIVDDLAQPAHSDEAIETALKPLDVEIWDWMKYDLCCKTIETAAPSVREITLYWSGNNAVLRGWSETEGLPSMRKLQKVSLKYNVKKGLESSRRARANVEDFRERMGKKNSRISVEIDERLMQEPADLVARPLETDLQRADEADRWLTPMDEFADFIQNIEWTMPEQTLVALVDDGVNLNERSLHKKLWGGVSFHANGLDGSLTKPYYASTRGHGTDMASLICRICPSAKLYVVKMDSTAEGKFTAESAAKAVQAAVDLQPKHHNNMSARIRIICMSWTIEGARDSAGMRMLDAAIAAAARKGILLFCASNDQGVASDSLQSYPASCSSRSSIFKIGAAGRSGAASLMTGNSPTIDFLFPGENIPISRRALHGRSALSRSANWHQTGSSVATAIATGLAALILHCGQIAVGSASDCVSLSDFHNLSSYDRMKQAFMNIGNSHTGGPPYLEVWRVFTEAAQKGELALDKEAKIKIVRKVANKLIKGTSITYTSRSTEASTKT